MSAKEVLLVLTDRWADWEPAYAIAEINYEPEYEVKTIALDKTPKASVGGIRAEIDYTLSEYDFTDRLAMVILPGGFTWEEGDYGAIADFVRKAESENVPIAAICGATLFLARHGFLDDRKHSGDNPDWFESLPEYKGRANFVAAQVVNDKGFITANETAAMEFSREISKALNLHTDEEIEQRYDYMKNGMFK